MSENTDPELPKLIEKLTGESIEVDNAETQPQPWWLKAWNLLVYLSVWTSGTLIFGKAISDWLWKLTIGEAIGELVIVFCPLGVIVLWLGGSIWIGIKVLFPSKSGNL